VPCLFGGDYIVVTPPFELAVETTLVRTLIPLVTIDSAGISHTTGTRTVGGSNSSAVSGVEPTYVVNGATLYAFRSPLIFPLLTKRSTAPTSYAYFTDFEGATPLPQVGYGWNDTEECASAGDLFQLEIPAITTDALSFMVPLSSDENYTSGALPTPVLDYLDSLDPVQEQMGSQDLGDCAPTTYSPTGCTTSPPSQCPTYTSTLFITSTSTPDVSLPTITLTGSFSTNTYTISIPTPTPTSTTSISSNPCVFTTIKVIEVPVANTETVTVLEKPTNSIVSYDDQFGEPEVARYTPAPVVNEPDTDGADTDGPDTDEPDTDVPDTDGPEPSEPVSNEPDTGEPIANEPDADEPDSNAPVTDEPEPNEPVFNEPPPTEDSDGGPDNGGSGSVSEPSDSQPDRSGGSSPSTNGEPNTDDATSDNTSGTSPPVAGEQDTGDGSDEAPTNDQTPSSDSTAGTTSGQSGGTDSDAGSSGDQAPPVDELDLGDAPGTYVPPPIVNTLPNGAEVTYTPQPIILTSSGEEISYYAAPAVSTISGALVTYYPTPEVSTVNGQAVTSYPAAAAPGSSSTTVFASTQLPTGSNAQCSATATVYYSMAAIPDSTGLGGYIMSGIGGEESDDTAAATATDDSGESIIPPQQTGAANRGNVQVGSVFGAILGLLAAL